MYFEKAVVSAATEMPREIRRNDVAIKVSNLSKCYQIYDKPQDRLKQGLWRGRKQFYREFWALRDVSFEVNRGETVGVIGRNGSGKSTLLQMICGTLTPTTGEIEVNGRVAALLELGAGFNPEFTGRENVYLNAAIMGLSQQEIERRFDAIAAFADIGEFIEQPVKTYSSGMYVRLAFAVATSVEPDILIVDEALSVGDIAFQNKCMMRIKKLKDQGTNVLFVSHDLSTLQMICDRVIWLHDGLVMAIGDPIKTSQEYYVHMTGTKSERQHSPQNDLIMQQSTGMARFTEFKLDWIATDEEAVFNVGEDIVFRFTIEAEQSLDKIVFAVSVYRADGDWIIGQTSREAGRFWPAAVKGELRRGRLVLKANCLSPGDYRAAFGAYSEDLSLCYALTELTLSFSVRASFPTWGKFIHHADWESVL